MEPKEHLGTDIKDLRKFRGTQKHVEAEYGVKQSMISRMEQGRHGHSTKKVLSFVSKLMPDCDITVRLAPSTMPFHAVINLCGESIFALMAWKLDEIANACEKQPRVKDWRQVVRETRRAAMACRWLAEDARLNDNHLAKPAPIGEFRDKWKEYVNYRYQLRLQYLFKLMRRANCWWF